MFNLFFGYDKKRDEARRYNCGGYALGVKKWLFCETYDDCRSSCSTEEEALEFFKTEILNFDNKLQFLGTMKEIGLENLPKHCEIILFRLDIRDWDGEIDIDDFHFVKRHKNHQWFHKPGGTPIQRIAKKGVTLEWPHGYYSTYNSEILVFTK